MKPEVNKFKEIVKALKGNLSKVADKLEVSRSTVNKWVKEDIGFQEIVQDARKRLLDDAIEASEHLAVGVPMLDNDGNIIGWIEKPDGQMLRYIMSTIGKDEGFNNNIDVTTNGKDVECNTLIWANASELSPQTLELLIKQQTEGYSLSSEENSLVQSDLSESGKMI